MKKLKIAAIASVALVSMYAFSPKSVKLVETNYKANLENSKVEFSGSKKNGFHPGVLSLKSGGLAVEGGSKMPAWVETLGEQGIKEVAAYVLTLSDRKLSEADQKLAEAGQARFAVCAGCHGADGRGMHAVGAPNLTDTIWLYGGSQKTVEETIRHGRNGAMPAWEARLGKEKVHLLAAYVYSLSHGGAKH